MSATLASPFSVLAPGESEAPSSVPPHGDLGTRPAPPPSPRKAPGHRLPSSPVSERHPGDLPLSVPPSRGTRASGPCHLPPRPGKRPRVPALPHTYRRSQQPEAPPSPPARPSPGKRFLPPRPQPIGGRRLPRRARPHPECPMGERGRGRAGRRCPPPWRVVRPGGAGGARLPGRV